MNNCRSYFFHVFYTHVLSFCLGYHKTSIIVVLVSYTIICKFCFQIKNQDIGIMLVGNWILRKVIMWQWLWWRASLNGFQTTIFKKVNFSQRTWANGFFSSYEHLLEIPRNNWEVSKRKWPKHLGYRSQLCVDITLTVSKGWCEAWEHSEFVFHSSLSAGVQTSCLLAD